MAARNWCFTLNNPEEHGCDKLEAWLEAHCIYGVVGIEQGAEGTKHWQGYFECDRPYRLSTLVKLGFGWHLEVRRGSREQAAEYCKKDGDYRTWGVWRVQGKRTDLDRVRNEVAGGGGMREVVNWANPAQIKTAEKWLTYNEEPRDWKPDVYYITGPSGSGKSRKAREIADEAGFCDDCYVKNEGSKWWDGYDGHSAVIIDDFRDSWWSITEILSLLDRYEKRVECKGGSRQFRPRIIIITCIRDLKSHYANTNECRVQLERRIDFQIDLTPKVDEIVDEIANIEVGCTEFDNVAIM